MQTLISEDPFLALGDNRDWNKRGTWPARWVSCPGAENPPFVTAYRCRFALEAQTAVRVHVTADERYELFLDGERVGRGSERGDANHWLFETYDFNLTPGEHVWVARVWSLGEMAAFAQMTVRPGFLLAPQEAEQQTLFGTGTANWEAKSLGGYTFKSPQAAWGTGANLIINGAEFDWNVERGVGEGWQTAALGEWASTPARNDNPPVHKLMPATLPLMMEDWQPRAQVKHVSEISSLTTHAIPFRSEDNLVEEVEGWQELLEGAEALTVPPHTRRRVLVDLENYYCAYPLVVTNGGAGSLVRIHWQESLFNEPNTKTKGNRDSYLNKYFVTIWEAKDGIGDTFLPDGGRRVFETLWWQCGRWVEIVVETQEEPLRLDVCAFHETRYPLFMESTFEASDARLNEIAPIALRTLQMCAHETYMDCPYYEQLQYIGDTRIQALLTYVLTQDNRLPRKALRMFDASRQLSGLTQSRYPTRVEQIIPTFSLWHVLMLHDFALWCDDPAFVAGLLPGARGILDHFLNLPRRNGLICAADGWNTLDWVPSWEHGNPPDADQGVSGVVNLMIVLTLTRLAELEEWHGEPELAARNRRHARELANHISEAFWNAERGLFADNREQTLFSEHAQIFALLGDWLAPDRAAQVVEGLLTALDLARATIYFTHYLFDIFHRLDRGDLLIERLGLWFNLKANGLKTTVEQPEPTRSDCHAWGAHPLFHYFVTLLGIRPLSTGFRTVRIKPALGPLTFARGRMVHPNGAISVELNRQGTGIVAQITLPDGLNGVFEWAGQMHLLRSGEQTLTLP